MTLMMVLGIVWSPLALIYTARGALALYDRWLDWRMWRAQRTRVLLEAELALRRSA